jgi:hypothetical protein
MKTNLPTETVGQPEQLHLPWNLTEWVDPRELRAWVEEKVARLNWDNPELACLLRTQPVYHPRMMLTLLSYAYLTAVFESEDVVNACYADPMLGEICGRLPIPEVAAIGRFRRDNRGLLRWLLQQVMSRAMQTRFALSDVAIPAGVKRLLLTNATERLELSRHMDRAAQGA